jgi:hypothetical protein
MNTETSHRGRTTPTPSRAAREALDAALHPIATRVAERFPEVVGLMLVGSFARDEGGFVETRGRLLPYNDLDLVAIDEGNPRKLREPLARLGHELTQSVGVDVDLWPVATSVVEQPPKTLFWLDVALGGGRMLLGPGSLLPVGRVDVHEVPLEEAARLLANRATGIALSRLAGEREDTVRFRRHVHKAVLAVGDALLLERRVYAPTVAARAARLASIAVEEPAYALLHDAYVDAAAFRLRPDRWVGPAHEAAWRELRIAMVRGLHLAFEARRLELAPTLLSVVDAERPLFHLFDAHPLSRVRSSAVHALLGTTQPDWLHPRERMARASIALAYEPDGELSRSSAAKWLSVCMTGDRRIDDELLIRGLESVRAQGG